MIDLHQYPNIFSVSNYNFQSNISSSKSKNFSASGHNFRSDISSSKSKQLQKWYILIEIQASFQLWATTSEVKTLHQNRNIFSVSKYNFWSKRSYKSKNLLTFGPQLPKWYVFIKIQPSSQLRVTTTSEELEVKQRWKNRRKLPIWNHRSLRPKRGEKAFAPCQESGLANSRRRITALGHFRLAYTSDVGFIRLAGRRHFHLTTSTQRLLNYPSSASIIIIMIMIRSGGGGGGAIQRSPIRLHSTVYSDLRLTAAIVYSLLVFGRCS